MNNQIENTPTLTTERLILRRFTADDAKAMFSIIKDEEVTHFLPWFSPTTVEETQTFMEKRFLARYLLPTAYQYAVCLKEDNLPIGFITMSEDDSHGLGYGLSKDFWRKGIITEGCRTVIEHLKQAGFPYITATHDVNNPRSGEIMKKLGMSYRYSYNEYIVLKEYQVTFRMYQLDFTEQNSPEYRGYLNKSLDGAFIEHYSSAFFSSK